MRRANLVLCLSLGMLACGSSGTNDVSNAILGCRSFSTAECTRLAACEPSQNIDVGNCTQLLQASNKCNQATCGTSTYSPSNAQLCLNDLQNQSCQDVANNAQPTSCAESLLCIPPA